MSAWADRSEQIDALSAALVKALGEMTDIARTKQASIPTKSGGSYGYRYADLGDTLQSIRPVLASNGLAVTQTATTVGDEVAISTTVLHQSGQYITTNPLTLPAGRTAQETGSAITYGRRYALMAIVGLAAEDDDGASAAPRGSREVRRTPSTPRNASDGPRTPEEGKIRSLLATLPVNDAARIRGEFKAHFASGLAEMAPERHGEALEWIENAISEWEHNRSQSEQ